MIIVPLRFGPIVTTVSLGEMYFRVLMSAVLSLFALFNLYNVITRGRILEYENNPIWVTYSDHPGGFVLSLVFNFVMSTVFAGLCVVHVKALLSRPRH